MHIWGDKWFEENGDDLYAAINFIENNLVKYGIGVCGKEKWGCYRDDFLRFWNGGLYEILFGYRCHIGTWKFNKYPKLKNIIDKIHHFIYFTLDEGTPKSVPGESLDQTAERYKNRKWKGLCYYSEKIGLIKLVHKFQAFGYNKTFQIACKKWPNIIDELISDIDGYKMIKPCKWGNIDGQIIHDKYWVSNIEN